MHLTANSVRVDLQCEAEVIVMRVLTLSAKNKKLSGVCGGIGEYFEIDATVIRLAWVLLTVLTGIVPGIVAYLIMSLVMPSQQPSEQS